MFEFWTYTRFLDGGDGSFWTFFFPEDMPQEWRMFPWFLVALYILYAIFICFFAFKKQPPKQLELDLSLPTKMKKSKVEPEEQKQEVSMAVPCLPKKKYSDLIERVSIVQWFVFGLIGAFMWLGAGFYFASEPWSTVGAYMFWISLALLIVGSQIVSLYDGIVVLTERSVGYYWVVKANGAVKLASPGCYRNNGSLFVLWKTLPMGYSYYYNDARPDNCEGVTIYTVNWTLQFDKITEEAAVAFLKWYNYLVKFNSNYRQLIGFLKREAERTDLPFKVILPREAA